MQSKLVFCTLFDSNYLDKGIALIRSLNNTCDYFVIYVLTLDEKCYSVLEQINLNNVVLIPRNKFIEAEDLVEIEKNRSNAEFCWTCTSHLIEYVLKKREERICTYLDADLFFYSNPKPLIDEMGNKTVQIVEHRFTKSLQDKISMWESGKFCVEFNTFKNSADSLELLEWWKKQCRESCSSNSNDNKVFGDQKYLEGWETKPFVSVLNNIGGGVAPWNVFQYRLVDKNNYLMRTKRNKNTFKLVFYHFHNISYLDNDTVDIGVYQRAWGVDDKLINSIYIPYLTILKEIKEKLKNTYDFDLLLKSHPALTNKKVVNNKKIKNSFLKISFFEKVYLFIDSKLKTLLNSKKNIIHF